MNNNERDELIKTIAYFRSKVEQLEKNGDKFPDLVSSQHYKIQHLDSLLHGFAKDMSILETAVRLVLESGRMTEIEGRNHYLIIAEPILELRKIVKEMNERRE